MAGPPGDEGLMERINSRPTRGRPSSRATRGRRRPVAGSAESRLHAAIRNLRRGFWIVGSSFLMAGCGADAYRMTDADARALTGGNAEEGQTLIREYGCGSCHTIAGLPGADGEVGPPLTGIASRMYIGGVLPNSPENLVHWIEDPKAVDPRTAMPDLGVTSSDARSIAAYLYTLP